jgi:hypothetical protein
MLHTRPKGQSRMNNPETLMALDTKHRTKNGIGVKQSDDIFLLFIYTFVLLFNIPDISIYR